LVSLLPEWVGRLLRSVWKRIVYCDDAHLCPVCGRSLRIFGSTGAPLREGAVCIHCGALERHRFVWLYFKKMTDLFDGKSKKMLHVAPEDCFENKLRSLVGAGYITADLYDSRAMIKMDIMDIPYDENCFDVIYCSHVLEHVEDDRQAMREFHRILKRGHWAVFMVPLSAEQTIEDPSITSPEERLKIFGQKDHVRRYGPDFVDRLRESGFQVKVERILDLFNQNEIYRMGLIPANRELYYCTKP
jgi:SAM-dependent methyltransferase